METICREESPGSALPPIVLELVLVLGFFKGRRGLHLLTRTTLSAHQVSDKCGLVLRQNNGPRNSIRGSKDGRYQSAFLEFGDQDSALDTSPRAAALKLIHQGGFVLENTISHSILEASSTGSRNTGPRGSIRQIGRRRSDDLAEGSFTNG